MLTFWEVVAFATSMKVGVLGISTCSSHDVGCVGGKGRGVGNRIRYGSRGCQVFGARLSPHSFFISWGLRNVGRNRDKEDHGHRVRAVGDPVVFSTPRSVPRICSLFFPLGHFCGGGRHKPPPLYLGLFEAVEMRKINLYTYFLILLHNHPFSQSSPLSPSFGPFFFFPFPTHA